MVQSALSDDFDSISAAVVHSEGSSDGVAVFRWSYGYPTVLSETR